MYFSHEQQNHIASLVSIYTKIQHEIVLRYIHDLNINISKIDLSSVLPNTENIIDRIFSQTQSELEKHIPKKGLKVKGSEPELKIKGSKPELKIKGSKPELKIKGSKPELKIKGSKPGLKIKGSKPGLKIKGSKSGLKIKGSKSGLKIKNSKPALIINEFKPGLKIKELTIDEKTKEPPIHHTISNENMLQNDVPENNVSTELKLDSITNKLTISTTNLKSNTMHTETSGSSLTTESEANSLPIVLEANSNHTETEVASITNEPEANTAPIKTLEPKVCNMSVKSKSLDLNLNSNELVLNEKALKSHNITVVESNYQEFYDIAKSLGYELYEHTETSWKGPAFLVEKCADIDQIKSKFEMDLTTIIGKLKIIVHPEAKFSPDTVIYDVDPEVESDKSIINSEDEDSEVEIECVKWVFKTEEYFLDETNNNVYLCSKYIGKREPGAFQGEYYIDYEGKE